MTSFESIGIIKLSGSECFTFLNNQTISKIVSTDDNVCHYSAICNPKGRVLFTFFVFTDSDQIHLAITRELASDLLSFLNMRRFRMDVKLENTDDLALCKTEGSRQDGKYPLALLNYAQVSATESIWPTLFKWNLPWIEKNQQEKHIPQHLSLDEAGAIDFTKGCYPGQEIIARLHYLGEIKKRMQLISVKCEDNDMPQETISGQIRWCSEAQKIDEELYRQAVVTLLK